MVSMIARWAVIYGTMIWRGRPALTLVKVGLVEGYDLVGVGFQGCVSDEAVIDCAATYVQNRELFQRSKMLVRVKCCNFEG